MRQNGALHSQVAALEERVMHLSQTLTQQQTLLNETNRIKFVQLTPVSSAHGGTARISPGAQRAIFLAMARELGWLPTDPASITEPGHDISGSMGTNGLKVDFVDLRSGTNRSSTPVQSPPEREPQVTGMPASSPPPAAPTNAIPAIVSSDHLVVAVDSTIAPSGSQLTFAGAAGQEPLGTVTMGDNPLVVTVPLASYSTSGGNSLNVIVASGAGPGISNVFQIFTPGTVPP